VDKGYPVIMGEYGVVRHSAPSARLSGAVRASRAYYLGTLVQKALSKGIIPFFWDNGYAGIGEDQFALFNRRDHMKQVDASAIAAIMKSVKTNKVKYRNR
jgi:endoglucanase